MGRTKGTKNKPKQQTPPTDPNRRYAITHVSADGTRQLTFGNQGRNHYTTREEAETALDAFWPDLRAKVLGDAADTLEVRWVECYEHGDAKGIYFDTPHSSNENRIPQVLTNAQAPQYPHIILEGKRKVIYRDKYTRVSAYAPGDGDLSFVASDTRTTEAVGPHPSKVEAQAICPDGWLIYMNGPNPRARKIGTATLTEAESE